MRDLIKSFFSFTGALSLFGAGTMGRMLSGLASGRKDDRPGSSLDTVAGAARRRLGPELEELFEVGDRLQREVVDALLGGPGRGEGPSPGAAAGPARPAPQGPPSPPPAPPEWTPAGPVDPGRLDTSCLVVLGENLAAGAGELSLHRDWQRGSFPARVAACLDTPLVQPLLEPPGLGDAPGFEHLPVRVPALFQATVLERFPPHGPFGNLSVPGLTLADALERRPEPPLVHRHDARQTALNLIVGLDEVLGRSDGPPPTPLEAAVRQRASLSLVELGYTEVLAATVAGDAAGLPEPEAFGARYRRLLGHLREAGAQVVAHTVPDPLDTAYVSSVEEAEDVLRLPPGSLRELWPVAAGDLVTAPGLHRMGFQIRAGELSSLEAGDTLDAASAAAVRRRVAELNERIAAAAREHQALVHDLHGLLRRLAGEGVTTAERHLTAGYLGGLYSLTGYWPGATGQAVIANDLLDLLEEAFGARFPRVDLDVVSRTDPVALYRPAAGSALGEEQLPRRPAAPVEPLPAAVRGGSGAGGAGGDDELVASKEAPPGPLRLPPGLEQVLPLDPATSYFGDGIRPIHARDPAEAGYGGSANLLFGGLALVDSHLSGRLRIRFSPPEAGVSRFEIDFGEGFTGEDAVLSSPRLFRMPFRHNRVDPVPGTVSSGELDLETGEVRNLQVFARYSSAALAALVGVNPHFPRLPLGFPGQYGTAWARFEPRDDGYLDFTFYGSSFVPLGPGTRWPLNFAGAGGEYATVPASGTAMHPHLALSTRPAGPPGPKSPPELPTSTVREYTLFTHNSSFGDKFDLAVPALGGTAMGRSHLLGRLEIQFGEPTTRSVPVAVWSLPPGGLLEDLPPSPLTENFPSRLARGPLGFNEFLRFPQRSYYLDGVYILDDPFDPCVGLVDRATGRLVGELLHRGFIGQDLIFALLRVEPRTPKDSFLFRGPARFERGSAGQSVFRFKGEVAVPYPAGYGFPQPNLTAHFVVEGRSALDPFYWLQAVDDTGSGDTLRGGAEEVRASNGELFSYSYEVTEAPGGAASFEYVNHSQGGRFRLRRLGWVDVLRSRHAGTGSGPDTVTFTGYGVWSKDGVESFQQVSMQASTAPGAPYVGIQVGGGAVSNVNTKPKEHRDALP